MQKRMDGLSSQMRWMLTYTELLNALTSALPAIDKATSSCCKGHPFSPTVKMDGTYPSTCRLLHERPSVTSRPSTMAHERETTNALADGESDSRWATLLQQLRPSELRLIKSSWNDEQRHQQPLSSTHALFLQVQALTSCCIDSCDACHKQERWSTMPCIQDSECNARRLF
jgi:hypothetical protein